jgi:L-ascorbate metabolism protein UlaG (beta-lactamase superfamily)
LSLTYLGHSAFKYRVRGLVIYTDPYYQEPVDWKRLEKGDVVLLTHGHFDHGVMITWMTRKYKRTIPADALIALDHGQSVQIGDLKILAVPALHPMTRIGKTIMAMFMRSRAPGNPVNGYFFNGYYQSGDTIYTPDIAASLKGSDVHTACLPIGGKYKTASPQEALRIAEEISAKILVPMHWQPLVEQVPFRYQPSHLVKLGKELKTKVEISPLAIGEVLEDSGQHVMDNSALAH